MYDICICICMWGLHKAWPGKYAICRSSRPVRIRGCVSDFFCNGRYLKSTPDSDSERSRSVLNVLRCTYVSVCLSHGRGFLAALCHTRITTHCCTQNDMHTSRHSRTRRRRRWRRHGLAFGTSSHLHGERRVQCLLLLLLPVIYAASRSRWECG